MSYRNNLKGNHRVGLLLDGRFDFNEKRKYKQTKEGRGVLKGRAFVDKNRDGKKQEDEIAVPRAIIRLKGTRMSLRTDNAGYFTVQNIKTGLYEVQIDARSLPLGFDLSDDVSTKVTIADGQITDVPMPIVQRPVYIQQALANSLLVTCHLVLMKSRLSIIPRQAFLQVSL